MKNSRFYSVLVFLLILCLALTSCVSTSTFGKMGDSFSELVESNMPMLLKAMENLSVGETMVAEGDLGTATMVKPQEGLLAMRTVLPKNSVNSTMVDFLYALEDGYQNIKFLVNRKTGFETSFITNISADGTVTVPIYASTSDDNTEGYNVFDLGSILLGENGKLEITSKKSEENCMEKVQKIFDGEGNLLSTTETIIDSEKDHIYVHALSMDGDMATARVEFDVHYGEVNKHEIHILDDKAMVVLTYDSKDGVEDLGSASLLHVVDTVSFIVDTTLDDVFALKHYKGGTVLEEDMLGKHNDRVMVDDDTLRSISIPHDGAGRVDSYTYRHGEGFQQICKFDDRMSHSKCIIVFEMDAANTSVTPVYFSAYNENPEVKMGFYPNKPFALFAYQMDTLFQNDGSVLKSIDMADPKGNYLGHTDLVIGEGSDGKKHETGVTTLKNGKVTTVDLVYTENGVAVTASDENGTKTVLF